MKVTEYFKFIRNRPDRRIIKDEWIVYAIHSPLKEETQPDGRFRKWAKIKEMDGKALRVILLNDGTVHNAFFDRSFKEDQ